MSMYRVPVLIPGTYRLSPSPGYPKGRRVTYSRADAEHAANQGKQMLKAGLSVPLCWMHPDEAEPAYLSNDPVRRKNHSADWLARGYFGEAKDYTVDPNGTVVALCEIADPEDAHQFQKVGRVSPSLLHDWMDEREKVWPGLSILHIGATPKPIQRDIGRVRPAAYLSQPIHRPAVRSRNGERILLSFPANITRSNDMADEIDDGADEGAGDGQVAKVAALLKRKGLHLGSPKNWNELHIALEAAVSTSEGGGDDDADDEGVPDDMEADAPPDTDTVANSPAYMSMAASLAEAQTFVLKQEIKDLKDSGRIDVKIYNSMLKDLEVANLSHEPHKKFNSKTGKLKPLPLHAKIAAYRELPPSKFSKANLGIDATSRAAHLINIELDTGDSKKSIIDDLKAQRGVK